MNTTKQVKPTAAEPCSHESWYHDGPVGKCCHCHRVMECNVCVMLDDKHEAECALSKPEPKQPTAAAMRAAVRIIKNIREYNELGGLSPIMPPSDTTAELIDTETGLPELIEAMKSAQSFLKHREDVSEVCYEWCPLCKVIAALARYEEK